MTCELVICAPDGTSVKARGLLDSVSTTSFVSERLVQALHLPRVSQNLSISGVTGLSHHSPLYSITNFKVSSVSRPAPRSKNQFQDFAAVMEKYFEMDHAELVPVADLLKSPKDVFYLPMHTVRKEHSTTTKIRAVFDTSAKSSTGVSLNDTLLVGPTVHPTLIDVLLRFRFYRVALTADVSKTIELHGVSDVLELAYTAVVYLRLTTSDHDIQISLVTSKTKVAPIKRLTIPRLELCGVHLLARLHHHVRQVLEVPLSHTSVSTDSTIVQNWLDGSPKRFKTYVGNRTSWIYFLLTSGITRRELTINHADCASRGLYPSELM